jgi:hypothetical protein
MQDLMEVFTVTHMTYGLVLPIWGSIIALFFYTANNLGNIFPCVFLLIFIFAISGTVLGTLDEVPYYKDRAYELKWMGGTDPKLDPFLYD